MACLGSGLPTSKSGPKRAAADDDVVSSLSTGSVKELFSSPSNTKGRSDQAI